MAKVRRIDFSPDEWLQGTRRLDNATRGLYITACALIYSIGRPIDREELRIACRDHGNAFNRQIVRLISLGKLEETDGKLMNKRCGIELEKAEIRSENASESAAKRWQQNETQDATAMHARKSNGNANHQPSTINPKTRAPARARNGSDSGRVGAPASAPAEPWEQRIRAFAKNGFWNPFWGPKPDEPGCAAPSEIVSRAIPSG